MIYKYRNKTNDLIDTVTFLLNIFQGLHGAFKHSFALRGELSVLRYL